MLNLGAEKVEELRDPLGVVGPRLPGDEVPVGGHAVDPRAARGLDLGPDRGYAVIS